MEHENREQKFWRRHAGKGELGRGRVSIAVGTILSNVPCLRFPIPLLYVHLACGPPKLGCRYARRKHAALVLSPKQIPIAGGGLKEIEGCIGVLLLRYRGLWAGKEREEEERYTNPLIDPATELMALFSFT